MISIEERLDERLERDTREYLDSKSEPPACRTCGGLGQIKDWEDGTWLDCPDCAEEEREDNEDKD